MADSIGLQKTILNFTGFQIGWFACVLGGANDMPWLGPLLAVPILAWHFSQANDWKKELKLILIIATVGSLFDQFLLWLGWIQYPASNLPSWLLPVWMTTLWIMFSSTLNVSLRWMHGKYVIGFIFGMIGGPVAYLAGQKLGAMELISQTNVLIVLAVGWAMMMPAMLWLSSILDGYNSTGSSKDELRHV